jgi:hypothetical protein
MAYYTNITRDGYRDILQRNRALVDTQGRLTYRGTTLKLRMHPFTIERQRIGPLIVTVTSGANVFEVKITIDPSSPNKSQFGHIHPHVDSGGRICWGSGGFMANQLAKGIDPLEFLFATAQFLKEGYQAGDAYCKIINWRQHRMWWCEDCDVEHPDGQQCPNQCSQCGQQVIWDEHGTCSEHGNCWSFNERETCPVCSGQHNESTTPTIAADAASAAE